MYLKLLELWRRIQGSFWFLPGLMVTGAVVLAFLNLYFDRTVGGIGRDATSWIVVGGVESARSLLGAIASSMITVAGVTFSIVIVALTLASSQFGPRLVAGFMQDTGNQVVLGTFISVFAYCLVVLVHLPGGVEGVPMPRTSVLTALALALVAVAVLIYFFHHISSSMRAGIMVQEASRALENAIRKDLVAKPTAEDDRWPPLGFADTKAELYATKSGYLSSVDLERLAILASDHGVRILVEAGRGGFVLQGQRVAWVKPPQKLTDELSDLLIEHFVIVEQREDADDLTLAFDRLTEIGVRGLSPGINDPYTAIIVLNRLTAGLDALLERLPTRSELAGSDGTPRVFFKPPDPKAFFERTFGPLRTYGQGDVRVLQAMIDSLTALGKRRQPFWDDLLLSELDHVLGAAEEGLSLARDRRLIAAGHRQARASFASGEKSTATAEAT